MGLLAEPELIQRQPEVGGVWSGHVTHSFFSQHWGGRGMWISINSRPVWFSEYIIRQLGLHREILPQKSKNKNNEKISEYIYYTTLVLEAFRRLFNYLTFSIATGLSPLKPVFVEHVRLL